jgi:hypothetical protein
MRAASIELRAVTPFDFDLALCYLGIWPAAVLEKIGAREDCRLALPGNLALPCA